ncbi:hypothetical protein WMY93_012010 [Mugilogobius chulae]|uniref:Uncharacterized protein n=1 Tax=Mugilogobius chulae TaxID=88201 RepID=A0AAW0P7Y4_9GOBI
MFSGRSVKRAEEVHWHTAAGQQDGGYSWRTDWMSAHSGVTWSSLKAGHAPDPHPQTPGQLPVRTPLTPGDKPQMNELSCRGGGAREPVSEACRCRPLANQNRARGLL